MWKRHSIIARKTAWDQARAKTYSMISKMIQLAAEKWADPKMNPALDLALQKARYHSVTREIINKAILKWSGQLEWENIEEILYEWYGPAGSAIIIKALTGNTNRSAANIKAILGKNSGELWLQNSVARQFQEKGIFVIDGTTEKIEEKWNTIEKIHPLNEEEFENTIIEMPILDFEIENGTAIVQTEKVEFITMQKLLNEKNYHIIEGDLQYETDNMITLSEEDKEKFLTLINALEEDEDVDKVRHNVENI